MNQKKKKKKRENGRATGRNKELYETKGIEIQS